MAHQVTTFLTLPPELREQVYEYIALDNTTRCIHLLRDQSDGTQRHKITTSAITATCRLIHHEYEDVARKNITNLDFTAIDVDLDHIIDYFSHHVDVKYLASLQANQATIRVDIAIPNRAYRSFSLDLQAFYRWALFLVRVKLEAIYHGDLFSWMSIHESESADLVDLVMSERHSSVAIYENIENVRAIAETFDDARWRAYPEFNKLLQARRRREWDRRVAAEAA